MSDLTKQEHDHVRAALRFLRTRTGSWGALGKALGFAEGTLSETAAGRAEASARLVLKLARFAGVGLDDVLAGRFPPKGACPTCGHVAEPGEDPKALVNVLRACP